MTATNQDQQWDYVGDGVTTTFFFDNVVYAASDLDVFEGGTKKLLTTDYAVTGIGAAGGGSVAFLVAPAVGMAVALRSVIPETQATQFPPGTAFPGSAVSAALDRVTRLAQQLKWRLGRSLVLTESDAQTASLGPLPNKAARTNGGQGSYLGFDGVNGDPTVFAGALGTGVAVGAAVLAFVQAASIAAARAVLGLGAAALENLGGNVVDDGAGNLKLANTAVAPGTYTNATVTIGSDGRATAAASGASPPSPVRQSALIGAQDGNGLAAFIAAGAGLTATLLATASPLTLSFAAGFNAAGGVDQLTQIAADQVNGFAGLAASNLSFLRIDRNAGTGALTLGATLAPPQYGMAYDRTRGAVLQFGGAPGSVVFLDDYGNTWTAGGGAKVQSNFVKFGTGALGGGGGGNALNGAADFIKTTDIKSLGGGSWALRCWVQPTALPGAGAQAFVISLANAGGFGVDLGISNNAGTIRWAYNLSSLGTAADIATLAVGTSLPVINAWAFVELTYDANSGTYRLYVNGTQEGTTASALRVCAGLGLTIGAASNGTAKFFSGYLDKPEFLTYCTHPAGTAYVAPAAAPSITAAGYAADWFDIINMLMRQVSAPSAVAGNPPATTALQRLYVGEANTSGVGVTQATAYALQGEYIGVWTNPLPAVTTLTSKNDNMGTDLKDVKLEILIGAIDPGSPPGAVGSILTEIGVIDTTANPRTPPVSVVRTRNTTAFQTGNNSAFLVTGANGAGVGLTAANHFYRLRARRAF